MVTWGYLGGDAAHTRYSPADEVNARKTSKTSKKPGPGMAPASMQQSGRSTPSYINGNVIHSCWPTALCGRTRSRQWRAHLVVWRTGNTGRYEYSMRADYGKGVAYAEVDGREIIYISSPAFFLTALDAETGKPLEELGAVRLALDGFPETGVTDMLTDLTFGPALQP